MDLIKISKFFTTQTLDEIVLKSGGIKHTAYKFVDGDNKKGDSYLSDVYRLKVFGTSNNGSTMEINTIVKAMPKSSSRRKIFRSSDFFNNEIQFYNVIIPAFEAFQRKRSPKNSFISYPKCLAVFCDGENDFVALEDLCFDGYKTPVRQNYTDIDTCKLIMRTLGRFHAVSLAYNDQQGLNELIKSIKERYYTENLRNWYGGFLKLATSVANDAITKTYPNSEYEEKAKIFLDDKLYDDMIYLVSKKTKYSVIGHGDCWRPNFLTKFDRNETFCKIIDFQIVRFASPVLDIMFFLYNSTSEDQRNMHYDQLINEYHQSACDLIRDLGSDPEKIFPMSGLQEELREFGRFACGFCIESLPLSMLDDDDVTDLDFVNCENPTLLDFWKIKPIENLENCHRLASIFKHSIDHGYIQ